MKAISEHKKTENDKEMEESEKKLDRIEYEVMKLHSEKPDEEFSPVVAEVRETRLMENFRYII